MLSLLATFTLLAERRLAPMRPSPRPPPAINIFSKHSVFSHRSFAAICLLRAASSLYRFSSRSL